ncbi:MAG: DUF3179 domain-containing protein [Saprospiraceae bacterium]
MLTFACANGRLGGNWSVPRTQIAEGEGSGDIPVINNPKFTKASEVTFLADTSLIIGMKIGTTIRAYPLMIMDWHEVVNDLIDTLPIALTYSTLSGSSIGLHRKIEERVLEFRISGLLYNSNTIFSEFETFSDWSQMLRKGIRGDFSEIALTDFPVFEMSWLKWKELFPESEVLNLNTSYNRPYGTYPYGDYQTDATKILFNLPLDIDSLDIILPVKEKILGVIVGESVKGYRPEHFAPQGFSLIQDKVNGEPVIIIGSAEFNTMVAYSAKANDGQIHQFTLLETENEILLIDETGKQWTIFGEAVENNDLRLQKLGSNIAYWFTWATFYPQIEIFN